MKFAALTLTLMLAFVTRASAATGMLADGFAPGLLLAVLFICAVLLILVGVGVAVGLACLASAAILAAFGVISSSAIVAIFKRRLSAGLRALHYQLLALVGMPCGIGSFWLACTLLDVQIRDRYILAIGSVIGVTAGVIIALILDRFLQFVIRRFSSIQRT